MKIESKLDLRIKVQSAHANKIKSADKIKFADQTIIPSTIIQSANGGTIFKWKNYLYIEQ